MSKMHGNIIDLTGQKFNRLTVLYLNGIKSDRAKWVCRCDCGKISHPITGKNLKNGNTKSCGCLHLEKLKERLTTHGKSKAPEYIVYNNMKKRCFNHKDKRYNRYGGRGIKICDRWLESFENFYSDMGSRPTPKHSIDRINNDGDYCPENCKWATIIEQNSHTNQTRLLTYNGETHHLAEWARITGLTYKTISMRIDRGWDIEKAITTSKEKSSKDKARYLTYNGEIKTLTEWSRLYNINMKVLWARINIGWSMERALNTKVR